MMILKNLKCNMIFFQRGKAIKQCITRVVIEL